MGIGGHHFVAAATIPHRFYDSPTVELVKAPIQGYSSTTCIGTFSDGNSVVLQFRPDNRAIDEEYCRTVHKQIGDPAPVARLLTKHEGLILVYELSRIPGVAFCELQTFANFIQALALVA